MKAAHRLGMHTTATMVYGLGETTADRVQHLLHVRDLRDRTGGFRAFIPWSFQSNHTRLSERPQSGMDYLRLVALSRLVLDDVEHIQAELLVQDWATRTGLDAFVFRPNFSRTSPRPSDSAP